MYSCPTCPKCQYALDISKSSKQVVVATESKSVSSGTDNKSEDETNITGGKKDTQPSLTVLDDVIPFINLAISDAMLDEYTVGFKINDLVNSSKFKKTSKHNQDTILRKFNELSKNRLSDKAGPVFTCINCGYEFPLKKGTTLYSKNNNSSNKYATDTFLLNEFEYKADDPILPRTKDYICQNKDCVTHKKNDTTKEAVFFRIKDSYKTIYMCCVCKKAWPIS
ncbi:MAG: putative DNA-dependent RNA polymerase subunit Rpb9 [Faunusvirus sp.]|jgi:hypothetical protein|uniref:Putative DNA-dependent RNA polymerase subunit Rpb9 n=1 Tax=Faunusvirus sp. TaxID=2487766 RepID=A0A3G4ZXZ2_9VIRU|nr:MAG: putative DNA-dependent RNA polymerase subunit Rpb9 [Faunusvirus sp.]